MNRPFMRLKLPQLRFITAFARFLARFIPGFRRLPFIVQKFIACILIVSTLISSVSFGILFNPFDNNIVEAAWYNEDWHYRQIVTLTNSSTQQTDVVTEVSLDTYTLQQAGKLQSDCDDIRFTNYQGDLLSHQTVSCSTTNGVNSTFWVTVDVAYASGQSTYIYVYYGNGTAISASTAAAAAPNILDTGTGADGACSVTADTNINTQSCVGRGNGDAIISTVSSNVSAGSTSVTVSSATGLAVNDEILIMNLQGTTSNSADVGEYEFATISSISTNTLTLDDGLSNGYDGTTQKIVVQRVPQYTSVTLTNSGTDFVPSDWNGTSGGVMAFRATGTVTVGAGMTINTDGLGYRGGTGGAVNENGGNTGESYDGASSGRGGSGAGGGQTRGGGKAGNGTTASPADGANTGGGGGGGSDGSANSTWGGGGGGGGGGYAGGGGGGGGNSDRASSVGTSNAGSGGTGGAAGVAGGGGGGGCTDTNTASAAGSGGNAGSNGATSASCNTANGSGGAVGSGATQGSGGGGGNSTAGSGAGGGGGGYYGTASLSTIFFGSGGGGGGGADSGGAGGNGVDGGGVIMISADTVSVNATGWISSNGQNPGDHYSMTAGGGWGGAGAGGSILLKASTLTLNTGRVSATGGSGNVGAYRLAGGGSGGDGRIALVSSSSSGTTTPTANTGSFTTVTAGSPGTEQQALSPIAYWRFTEAQGTSTSDSSSNGNTGTLTSMSTNPSTSTSGWQTPDQCIQDVCIRFDGSNDYVSVGNNNPLKITGNLTMEAWVKLDNTSSTHVIAAKNGSSGSYGYRLYTDTSGKLNMEVSSNGTATTTVTGITPLVANRWYHLAGVYVPSTSMTVYVNGVYENTNTTSIPASINNTSSSFLIGAEGTGSTNLMAGTMEEIKVYNLARTAAQIKADYNTGFAPEGISTLTGITPNNNYNALNQGQAGYYKFDEGSGASVTDYSGKANTLTSTGSPSYVAGRFNTALDYNGSSQYSSSNTLPTTNTSNFAVSAWVYPGTLTGTQLMVFNGKDDSGWGFGIDASTGGTGGLVALFGAVGWYDSGYDFPAADRWYHVTMTRDDTTTRFYVNGVLQSGVTTTAPSTPSGKFSVGAETDSNGSTIFRYYDGRVDDVRVYNRGLTDEDALALYNFGPSPSGYWRFEEASWTVNCSTTSVLDYSTNGLNGSACPNSTGPTANNPGRYGKGAFLDGSDDYISVADNSLLEPANDMTLEAWVKLDVLPSTRGTDMTLFYKLHSADPWFSYQAYIKAASTANTVCWDWSNNTGTIVAEACSTTALTATNTWYHLSFIKSGTDMKVAINGTMEGTASQSPTGTIYNSNGALAIGSVDGTQKSLDGTMDEAKIYPYARTAQQIVEDMNANHPSGGSPVGTSVGYWKFDFGAGTTAQNSGASGSTLNGTLGGMAAPATSTSGWTQSGKYSKALQFDGTDDRVTFAEAAPIDLGTTTDSYAMSAWIKTSTDFGSEAYVVAKDDGSGAYPYKLYIDSSEFPCFKMSDGTNAPSTCGTATINDGAWHHLTGVRDVVNDKLYIYVDGRLANSTTDTTTATAVNADNFSIGNGGTSYTTNDFTGTIDEVRFYGGAITIDTVRVDMNRGSAQVQGSLGTDSSSVDTFAQDRFYCPPGTTDTCDPPVVEYLFDEASGTANDTSGNANDGTLNGNTTRVTGKVGKGAFFDGTGDYFSKADAASLDFASGESFTLSIWVKWNSSVATSFLVAKGAGGTAIPGYTIVMDSGQIPMVYLSKSGEATRYFFVSNTTITDTNWHHIVFVLDRGSNNLISSYIDGKFDNSGALTNYNNVSLDGTSALAVGCYSSGTSCFNGSVDNFKLFRYALTPAEIAWEYNRGAPIAHWKMDECQGTTINDSAGNSLTGTLTNATAGNCSTNASTAWYNGRDGKLNSSISFDGSDDYITMGDPSSGRLDFGANDFSVSYWLKTTKATRFDMVQKGSGTGGNASLGIYWDPTTGLNLHTDNGAGANSTVGWTGGTTLNDGNWHHIVVTRSGTTLSIFSDGLSRATATQTVRTLASTQNFCLGKHCQDNNYFVNGQMDDVRVYNYALTVNQIRTLYTGGAVNYAPTTGIP